MIETLQSVLIIAPHPDDETLGAGGLAHRAARLGSTVSVLCCTADPQREGELRDACAVLGVSDVDVAYTGESWLDTFPLVTLVGWVEKAVATYRPDLVVMPRVATSHQEHRVVAEACYAALRPAGGTDRFQPPIVWSYEYAADHWTTSVPEWPTVYVRLEDQDLDAKLKAMAAHGSQACPCPRCGPRT